MSSQQLGRRLAAIVEGVLWRIHDVCSELGDRINQWRTAE